MQSVLKYQFQTRIYLSVVDRVFLNSSVLKELFISNATLLALLAEPQLALWRDLREDILLISTSRMVAENWRKRCLSSETYQLYLCLFIVAIVAVEDSARSSHGETPFEDSAKIELSVTSGSVAGWAEKWGDLQRPFGQLWLLDEHLPEGGYLHLQGRRQVLANCRMLHPGKHN